MDENKIVINFSHANGFPAASYNTLFSALPVECSVMALDKFGHSPHFPVSVNWANQVAELIHYVENHASGPVYNVGHSFGAVVSYMAACKRPELFKGLIMLDPPLVTGAARFFFRLIKSTSLVEKYTPAGLAQNRCAKWPEETDMLAYFKARKLFSRMDDRCVQDYIDAVMELRDEHYHLNFNTQVEADIFRNVPTNITAFYGKLECPAFLLTGEQSEVCKPGMLAPFVKRNLLVWQRLAGGGHMFPLEQPEQVASLIGETVLHWESQR